jgi:protease PrsW
LGGTTLAKQVFVRLAEKWEEGTRESWLDGRFLAAVGLGLAVVAIGLLVVQLLLLSRPSRLAVAVALGVLPLLLPAHLALWHHRAEPEYRKVLPVAFAWGASLAVLVSAALNNASSWLWGPLFGMLVAAPLFEEVAKAAVLFVLFQSQLLGRRPVRDGIVTAIMVGLGFALTENALYYGTTLATIGTANLAELFPLRAALSPFAHSLFSSMAGVGLGLSLRYCGGTRVVVRVAGLLTATALHTVWNWAAATGFGPLALYLLVVVPLFAGMLFWLSARQETTAIAVQSQQCEGAGS